MGGHVAGMEEMKSAYRILVGKSEEKRILGRPRRVLEDNIRLGLREMCWKVMDRMHLARNGDLWRFLVNTVTNLYKRRIIS
jgi:hypothetical protein